MNWRSAPANCCRLMRPRRTPWAGSVSNGAEILTRQRSACCRMSAAKLPESEVQFHLGMTCYMMADEDAARAALQRALQPGTAFPGSNECQRCLSILNLKPATADAAARSALEKRVSEKADDPVALVRLARIYQRDGNWTSPWPPTRPF